MTRDELWDAYETAQAAWEAHAQESRCAECAKTLGFCETRCTLSEACTAARQAWKAAAPMTAELLLWRVVDANATWGEPEEALILAASAQDAARWFLAEYERAKWQEPHSLSVTPAELPDKEGILLTSYISG